ncbi:MAG TPA: hypothetical protein VL261_16880 [Nitrospira sp.]|jgi:hypothetical protein|nr:hypothetical protein [Nitrospira sp.]
MQKILQILLTMSCLLIFNGEAKAVTISIDPLRTFLFTNNDPWSGIGSVQPSIPIALGSMGISAGDVIELDQLGDYYDGRDGYGSGVNTLALDTSTEMIGIFSSSDTLLAPNVLDRVPGAIDAGLSVTSWNTLFGNMSTDIPYDFRVANTIVQVPVGATYLFIAAHDIYYSDNSDPDGDYAVRITQMSSSAPVPESSAMFGLGFIFVAVLHAFCVSKARVR